MEMRGFIKKRPYFISFLYKYFSPFFLYFVEFRVPDVSSNVSLNLLFCNFISHTPTPFCTFTSMFLTSPTFRYTIRCGRPFFTRPFFTVETSMTIYST